MEGQSPQQYEPIVLIENYSISRGDLKLPFKPLAHRSYSIQIIATGLDAADGSAKVQMSNNPDLSWDDHPTFIHTFEAGSSSHTFLSTVPLGTSWLQVVLSKGSNTTGMVTVILQINK